MLVWNTVPSQRLLNLKYLSPWSDNICSSFLQCLVKRIPSIPRSLLPSPLPQDKFTLLWIGKKKKSLKPPTWPWCEQIQIRQCVLNDPSVSYLLPFWWHGELPRGTTFACASLTSPREAEKQAVIVPRCCSKQKSFLGYRDRKWSEYVNHPLKPINLESVPVYDSNIIAEVKITPKSPSMYPRWQCAGLVVLL